AHDVPLGCAPDEYDDLISGTCSHLPKRNDSLLFFFLMLIKYFWMNIDGSKLLFLWKNIFTLYVTRM
ncbi:hypothetical protein NXG64_28915, partial [Klebsiella pneumoniae]|nr:hypothetical protein [Klebsiella pneumoniae]